MLRELRRKGVEPDERSYAHVLHACAQSGQVRIALTLLEELSSTTVLQSPQIYGAALNACAKGQSVKDALVVLKGMQERSIPINTVHVGALLSALANSGEEGLALEILHNFENGTSAKLDEELVLQPITLDLVAINTILAACAKADNFDKAKEILQQLKSGHFEGLTPDVISYNTVLSACSDAIEAKLLVKEMRESRRWRYGVVLPTPITYTHAISACRGNIEAVRFFLDLAKEDGLEANVFIYSAAIWACPETAQEYWEEMRSTKCAPNIVSYNGMISALASQDRAEEALSLYEELKDNNLRPSCITFKVRSILFVETRVTIPSFVRSNPALTFFRDLPLQFVNPHKALPSPRCLNTF
jgi:pentatricopeptide repeat protein